MFRWLQSKVLLTRKGRSYLCQNVITIENEDNNRPSAYNIVPIPAIIYRLWRLTTDETDEKSGKHVATIIDGILKLAGSGSTNNAASIETMKSYYAMDFRRNKWRYERAISKSVEDGNCPNERKQKELLNYFHKIMENN